MKIELQAYGKVNLGLDVLRRRPDGYHDLDMIMQMVDVYDDIVITKNKTGKIEVKMIMQTVKLHDTLTFETVDEDVIVLSTNADELPVNEDNLVYKACRMLKQEYQITRGIRVFLQKELPVAAGMAGGSADAAAALIGMNKIFDLQIPKHKLMEYGVKLGADVPYCIMKGTALSEGIGEKLTALAPMPDCYILLAKPPIAVSTKMVYENLHANELKEHPDIDGMVIALEEHSLQGITERMENVLETVTQVRYPVIAEIKACMKECGAMNSLMSGSGPTVFGIFTEKEKAEKAADAIRSRKLAKQVFVTQPYNV